MTFFKYVAWLLVVAAVVSTLCAVELRPVAGASAHLERFAALAAIGAAFCLGYPKHRATVLGLIVISVGLLELAQNVTADRHGRLPDAMVKTLGALTGMAISILVQRIQRLSQSFFSEST